MKRVLLATGLMLAAGTSLVAAMGGPEEEKAVREVVKAYTDGVGKADRALFEKSWNIEFGDVKYLAGAVGGGEEIRVLTIDNAIYYWTKKPIEDFKAEVLAVEVVNNKMAMAKIQTLARGKTYIEYLTLLKTDKAWQIVSKVFVGK